VRRWYSERDLPEALDGKDMSDITEEMGGYMGDGSEIEAAPDSTDELDNIRKEMRFTIARAAMKNMTTPQAKVFALEVELYTDKYVQRLITAHTAASNKALLERLKARAKHMDDFVNNVEAVPLAVIEAERQQLGKESSDA
jgi:hypothetical protein